MVNQETPKILIVDDRPANLLAMKTILAGSDAELFTAESGNEALKLTIHHEFALILLDVQMPEMDGYEVATLLREREDDGTLAAVGVAGDVIVLSAHGLMLNADGCYMVMPTGGDPWRIVRRRRSEDVQNS